MIPSISIMPLGMPELRRSWGRMSKDIADWTAIWDEVAQWWYKHVEKQFDSEGSHVPRGEGNELDSEFRHLDTGGKWRPLTDRYKKWKDKIAPGKPILQLTGDLKAAATGRSPNAYLSKSKTRLQAGVHGLDYARIHQLGGDTIFGGTIPPRPYAVVPARGSWQLKQLDQIIGAYIREKEKEWGA